MKKLASWMMAAFVFADVAAADALIATRLIRPGDVVTRDDMEVGEVSYPGAVSALEHVVGMEARVTIFPGRPVSLNDIRPPRLVRRNELVTLIYRRGQLDIRTEGRSLSDGVAGDVVQVMNLDSRSRLSGTVSEAGNVLVHNRK